MKVLTLKRPRHGSQSHVLSSAGEVGVYMVDCILIFEGVSLQALCLALCLACKREEKALDPVLTFIYFNCFPLSLLVSFLHLPFLFFCFLFFNLTCAHTGAKFGIKLRDSFFFQPPES